MTTVREETMSNPEDRDVFSYVPSDFGGWNVTKNGRFFSGPYGRPTDAIDAMRKFRVENAQ